MDFLLKIIEVLLRLFGVFWFLGSFITIQKARESIFLDSALSQISQEKVDKSDSYFLLFAGLLTMLSGLFLLLLKPIVIVFLLLLICSQLFYFQVKKQRYLMAQSPEDKADAQVNPATKNAFNLSVVITIVTIIYFLLELTI